MGRSYKPRREKRQALLYLLLSAGFIYVMIRWGVPGMINFLSWQMGSRQQERETLTIKPQQPTLSPLPEATFSAQIKVTGLAQTGNKIKLRVNSILVEEKSVGDNGRFEFGEVKLIEGDNQLEVVAVGEKDVESDVETAFLILDTKTPEIEIQEPAEGQEFYGLNQRQVVIKGKVSEANARVTINDSFVRVDSEGLFEHRWLLKEGVNELVIKAMDEAGNRAEKKLKLSYFP